MRRKRYIALSFLILFLFRGTAVAQFSSSGVEQLQQRLDSITVSVKDAGIQISVKVVHADYNRTLYEHMPGIEMIPASITKLVTSACAFSKLGPGYYIETKIFTDDHDISDGVVNGNIYLKGYGDPDLNSGDIKHLAELLSKQNIREISGNIVADETFFDTDYRTLSGYFRADTGPSYWPYVNALPLDKNDGYSDPALNAAGFLSQSLISLGITVNGSVISGTSPQSAKELAQTSHSLFDVLSYMNKESDNHSAITIFKLLGAKLISNPGSLEKGQQVIESFLTEIGVPRYSYEILEGSGLTRYNKVNAEMFIKLLKYMYDDRFLFDYFMNSLSVSGKDGTLAKRMVGTEAERNVFAKTGTLNGVSALCGYVIDRDSEILIFYVTMNGFGGNANDMRTVQDNYCITLAGFSRK